MFAAALALLLVQAPAGDVVVEVEDLLGPWKRQTNIPGYRGLGFCTSNANPGIAESAMRGAVALPEAGTWRVFVRALRGSDEARVMERRALAVGVVDSGGKQHVFPPTHAGSTGGFGFELAGELTLTAGAIELVVRDADIGFESADTIVLTSDPSLDSADMDVRYPAPTDQGAALRDAWRAAGLEGDPTQLPPGEWAGAGHLARLASATPTLAAWQGHAALVRRELCAALQLDLDEPRAPVEPVVTARRELDGYSVEDVGFQVAPGDYVTGNLYRPLGRSGPCAAVLSAHGHLTWQSPDGYGRFAPESQLRAAALARMGAVVFAYDMLGWGDSREAGFDVEHWHASTSARRVGDERHDLPPAPDTLRRQTWRSVRALDYVLSLDGVDPARVGMTGSSGGGTQTFVLAALDARVRASAPVVMVSATFQGGCVCETGLEVRRGARHETSSADIAALAAPRPQLLVSCGGDWTAATPRLEMPYLRRVYGLFDAATRVTNEHFADEGHDFGPSKRRAVYAFFARELGLDLAAAMDPGGGLREEAARVLAYEDLLVFDATHPRPADWRAAPAAGEVAEAAAVDAPGLVAYDAYVAHLVAAQRDPARRRAHAAAAARWAPDAPWARESSETAKEALGNLPGAALEAPLPTRSRLMTFDASGRFALAGEAVWDLAALSLVGHVRGAQGFDRTGRALVAGERWYDPLTLQRVTRVEDVLLAREAGRASTADVRVGSDGALERFDEVARALIARPAARRRAASIPLRAPFAGMQPLVVPPPAGAGVVVPVLDMVALPGLDRRAPSEAPLESAHIGGAPPYAAPVEGGPGPRVALACGDGSVRVTDVASGALLARFDLGGSPTVVCDVSAEGSGRLVAFDRGGRVLVVDAATLAPLRAVTLEGEVLDVRADGEVALVRQGAELALARPGGGPAVRLVRRDGGLLPPIGAPSPRQVAWSADGALVALRKGPEDVAWFDVTSGRERGAVWLDGPQREVDAVELDPVRGQVIVGFGQANGEAGVDGYDLATGARRGRCAGGALMIGAWVSELEALPGGLAVYGVSPTGVVLSVDLASWSLGRLRYDFTGGSPSPLHVRADAASGLVGVAGMSGNRGRVLHAGTGACVLDLHVHDLWRVTPLPGGKTVAALARDGGVTSFALETGLRGVTRFEGAGDQGWAAPAPVEVGPAGARVPDEFLWRGDVSWPASSFIPWLEGTPTPRTEADLPPPPRWRDVTATPTSTRLEAVDDSGLLGFTLSREDASPQWVPLTGAPREAALVVPAAATRVWARAYSRSGTAGRPLPVLPRR